MSVRILIGDCLERMRELPDASVDSVVTDPPYHLTNNTGTRSPYPGQYTPIGKPKQPKGGFMGQQWDGGDVAFRPETWTEVLRVLKPGAHLVAFSGSRTYHRMACAIEDAGFEIRDQLQWIYASGFPKSHNLPGGLGTALKPAHEPICLARKPLEREASTVAASLQRYGTGALNIDATRIPSGPDHAAKCASVVGLDSNRNGDCYGEWKGERTDSHSPLGRWPANIIHDGSEEVLEGFPETGPAKAARRGLQGRHDVASPETFRAKDYTDGVRGHDDDGGSAARFFYCAKATSEERGEGNNHPTVKPTELMRWLCRLITPKGGTILDPFAGSGSTLVAADMEQFNAIGCELSPEYAAIAERRVRNAAGMFAEVLAA